MATRLDQRGWTAAQHVAPCVICHQPAILQSVRGCPGFRRIPVAAPVIIMPLSGLRLGLGCRYFGEARVERGAEFRHVQVAVDAAELVTGFEHPSGAPARRHGRVAPAFDVLGVLPADLDHRLDPVGGVQRAARVGGTPSREAGLPHTARQSPPSGELGLLEGDGHLSPG